MGAVDRSSYIRALLAALDDPLVVSNLGSNTYDLHAVADRPTNLYLWGGMGLTHSVGLGLAIAQPQRQVVVLDGDGSLLMGLGGLATIGSRRPRNLLHVVFDNHCWENTGGQPIHTAWSTELAAIARGCGFEHVFRVPDGEELTGAVEAFRRTGPVFVRILVVGSRSQPPFHPEPAVIQARFRAALGLTDRGDG